MSASDPGAEKGARTFPAFPHEPYSIQLDFMRALYDTLEAGGIGLFESPTGTGKTLSLICSALQWLQDKHERDAAATDVAAEAPAGPDADAEESEVPAWMRNHTVEQAASQQRNTAALRVQRIQAAQAKLALAKQEQARAAAEAFEVQGGRGSAVSPTEAAHPDAEFLLEDCDSHSGPHGAGAGRKKRCRGRRKAEGPSFGDSSDSDGDADDAGRLEADPEAPKRTQVIFCSRTHSQLTQFVSELARTPFAASMSMVLLASRKALCINPEVTALGSAPRINEACTDLQQKPATKKAAAVASSGQDGKSKTKKAAGGCPFLTASAKSRDSFRDTLLAAPLDVEALAGLGRRRNLCPYYGGRAALPDADLVLLPYGALLLEEARAALGVRLEGAVLIVDEAHNLVDAVNGAHGAALSRGQLAAAQGQLSAYYERFRTRLAPGNSKQLQTLLKVCTKLLQFLGPEAGVSTLQCHPQQSEAGRGPGPPGSGVARTVNDFLFAADLDDLNMFQIVRFVRESKVLFKVAGYGESQRARAEGAKVELNNAAPGEEGSERMSALHALVGFLHVLTNADVDGRIIVDAASGSLKFVLLNAAAHFTKVVSAAHAVVLASGTLAPVEALSQQLFPGAAAAARIRHFSCGHVVSKDRLLALAIGQGPSGAALDLRHSSRAAPATLDELGRLLLNMCRSVPQGLVVFFPSFSYTEQACAHWQRSGALAALEKHKRVFREPRSAAAVESILAEYADCMSSSGSAPGRAGSGGGGAVLLCIVGGKMSEGINFGDGLGRCVLVLGLPYPNPSDPELQERMRFMDSAAGNAFAGREHYENLCMKAVNQCIGRVIRHRRDFAAIVLVDARYAAEGVPNTGPCRKLPAWVKDSFVHTRSFGEAYGRLIRFYRAMALAEEAGAAT